MARPRLTGLRYFPMDTDYFDDTVVRCMRHKFGDKSVVYQIYLLCQIYKKKGYYVAFDESFIENAAAEVGCEEREIVEMTVFLVKKNFFDKKLYRKKLLSSPEIQLQYQLANKGVRREIEVDGNLWLLDEEKTLSFITPKPCRWPQRDAPSADDAAGADDGALTTYIGGVDAQMLSDREQKTPFPASSAPSSPGVQNESTVFRADIAGKSTVFPVNAEQTVPKFASPTSAGTGSEARRSDAISHVITPFAAQTEGIVQAKSCGNTAYNTTQNDMTLHEIRQDKTKPKDMTGEHSTDERYAEGREKKINFSFSGQERSGSEQKLRASGPVENPVENSRLPSDTTTGTDPSLCADSTDDSGTAYDRFSFLSAKEKRWLEMLDPVLIENVAARELRARHDENVKAIREYCFARGLVLAPSDVILRRS